MISNDFDYDTDNIDIEEEMINKDIEEEEESSEAEMQALIDAEEEQTFKKLHSALNAKNLDLDLGRLEPDRHIFKFSKDGIAYKGHVVHKLNKNTYIFCVDDKENPNGKLKKFNLSEIK